MVLLRVKPKGGNRIAFEDCSNDDSSLEYMIGPSPHEEEAFKDAQNEQLSPIRSRIQGDQLMPHA